MNNIPFNLYIGCEMESSWHATEPGERRLIAYDFSEDSIRMAIYYPSIENTTHSQAHWVPARACKLVLRSIDDDMTAQEKEELAKMGFKLYPARNYVLDVLHGNRLFSISETSRITAFLIARHFSVGIIPKSKYTLTTKKNAA